MIQESHPIALSRSLIVHSQNTGGNMGKWSLKTTPPNVFRKFDICVTIFKKMD